MIAEGASIHESSYIDDGAQIGYGTRVWHFCHVMTGAVIGRNCSFGQNVFVGSNVLIGDNVKIQNNVSVYTGVQIEDDVFLGPSVVFTNVINPRSRVSRKDEYRATILRRGASVGANATVVCGVTLGMHSFVGAGAVVTHDVPAYGLVYGAPAQLRGWMCQCGAKLAFGGDNDVGRATCSECGLSYLKAGLNVQTSAPA